ESGQGDPTHDRVRHRVNLDQLPPRPGGRVDPARPAVVLRVAGVAAQLYVRDAAVGGRVDDGHRAAALVRNEHLPVVGVVGEAVRVVAGRHPGHDRAARAVDHGQLVGAGRGRVDAPGLGV